MFMILDFPNLMPFERDSLRFREAYLVMSQCQPRPKVPKVSAGVVRKATAPRAESRWMENFHLTSPEKPLFPENGASPQVCDRKPIRYRDNSPASCAFTVFKASAQEFHQSKLVTKSKTLGR